MGTNFNAGGGKRLSCGIYLLTGRKSTMSIFQRVVLLLKVLVMLSLGMSSAWATTAVQSHSTGFVAAKTVQAGGLQLAKSESEPGDEDQGGSKDDDDQQAPPDDDDSDAGDGDSDT
jgi:hypothetical protein